MICNSNVSVLNKISLDHSHTHLCVNCPGWLLCYNSWVVAVKTRWPITVQLWTEWPSAREVCWCLRESHRSPFCSSTHPAHALLGAFHFLFPLPLCMAGLFSYDLTSWTKTAEGHILPDWIPNLEGQSPILGQESGFKICSFQSQLWGSKARSRGQGCSEPHRPDWWHLQSEWTMPLTCCTRVLGSWRKRLCVASPASREQRRLRDSPHGHFRDISVLSQPAERCAFVHNHLVWSKDMGTCCSNI